MIYASVPDFGDFADEVEDFSKKEIIETIYKLWDVVISISPVLRGHYRASWKISTGDLDDRFIRQGGTEESPLPPPARPTVTLSDDFPVVFISNAIPYAELIENGYSGKAPAGVLDVAIASLGL